MARQEVIGARLREFTQPGSLGVVNDVTYRRCFWPVSAEPFNPFAKGSSGIEVEGPPTPRNIIFPTDTVFLGQTRGDCFFRKTAIQVEVQVERQQKTEIVVEGKTVEATYLAKTLELLAALETTDLTAEEVAKAAAEEVVDEKPVEVTPPIVGGKG